jgi:hypothetical protein
MWAPVSKSFAVIPESQEGGIGAKSCKAYLSIRTTPELMVIFEIAFVS